MRMTANNRHGRKVGPSPGIAGLPGPLGTPGSLGPPGTQEPPVPQEHMDPGGPQASGPSDPLEPQDLRTLGELPLPFEIQILNTQKH